MLNARTKTQPDSTTGSVPSESTVLRGKGEGREGVVVGRLGYKLTTVMCERSFPKLKKIHLIIRNLVHIAHFLRNLYSLSCRYSKGVQSSHRYVGTKLISKEEEDAPYVGNFVNITHCFKHPPIC